MTRHTTCGQRIDAKEVDEREEFLIKELRQLLSLTSQGGRDSEQSKFYAQALSDARPVRCVRLGEVMTEEEVKRVLAIVRPEAKACYRNAAMFAMFFPEAKVVIGRMECAGIMGIDHAFNLVRGRYVDLTMEFAVQRDPSDERYIRLGEYTGEEARTVALKEGCYTNLYSYYYDEPKRLLRKVTKEKEKAEGARYETH